MEYLTEAPLELASLLAENEWPQCGGLAIFGGAVRDHHEGRAVLRLRYSAYAPLARRLMAEIEAAARTRFGAPYCRVVHRLGLLEIGDVAIYAIARAPHRAEAFAACRFLVDEVKHRVPIWKEEFYADGSSAFVEGCCIRQEDGTRDPGPGTREEASPHHVHHGVHP